MEYEIARQVEVVEAGGSIVMETRHWDEEAGVTHSMRIKEGSSDYRYFTEPDLVPMLMDETWVNAVRADLPELPADRRNRYQSQGLDSDLAGVLSAAPTSLRDVYETAVEHGADAKSLANWLTGEVTAWLRRSATAATDIQLTGAQLSELIDIVDQGLVSSSAAKDVLAGVLEGEGTARGVAESRDLIQISDTESLGAAVDEVLDANPEAVESYRSGEEKVVGFLVGQVMRATQGKADPKLVNELVRDKLAG